MTDKTTTANDTKKKQTGIAHPGMMGDGTEEQNLNERGNPEARLKKTDVDAAFSKNSPATTKLSF
jgi:hypothetical protein